MIRFEIAYCPCCMGRLSYNRASDFFYCDCEGWQRLTYHDRQKELDAVERYDTRRDKRLEGFLNGKKDW